MPLSCTQANLPLWYKWIVLCTACISTFCSFGYIIGTTSIATVYYVDRYNETLVSSLIGPAQIGFMQLLSLPSLFMGRIVGNMALHLIGALVFSGGIALTSLSYLSWQGFLFSGLMAGFGGAMMQVATTQMIKVYFPGRQFAPFGFLCITSNSAAMVYPAVYRIVMSYLNWTFGLRAIASALLVNLLCGFTYIEPADGAVNRNRVDTTSLRPRFRLLLPAKSTAHCEKLTPLSKTYQDHTETRELLPDSLDSISEDELLGEGQPDVSEKLNNINLKGMRTLLTRPQSIALLLMSFLHSGALTAVYTIMSYHAEVSFQMTRDEIAVSLTVMGLSRIVSAVGYLFLTACTEFSATLLHCICMYIFAVCFFLMSFITNAAQFTALISVIGFTKALTSGNSVPVSTELSKPELAMDLYVLKFLADGVGTTGVPYLAAHLRDIYSAKLTFYLSAGAMLVSASLFLPFIKRYIRARTVQA